jgi:hypothetical protein
MMMILNAARFIKWLTGYDPENFPGTIIWLYVTA